MTKACTRKSAFYLSNISYVSNLTYMKINYFFNFMATTKKIETVKAIFDKLSKANSVVLTNYQGLTHKQLEDLRKLLKTKNAEFVITKNTLLLRALGEFLHLDKPDLDLSSQTATMFSYEDEVEPLKLLI